MELDEGAISVDGLNIAKLGLAQLRNAMAIIPQVCTMSLQPKGSLNNVKFGVGMLLPSFPEQAFRNTQRICNVDVCWDLSVGAAADVSCVCFGERNILYIYIKD